MNKFPLFLIAFALAASACASGGVAPTTAPTDSPTATQPGGIPVTGEPPAGTPAITEQPGSAVKGTPTPGTKGQNADATAAATAAALGGPVVVTVEPGSGTAEAQGNGVPAPAPTPIPTLSGGLAPTELKYRVLAEFPTMFYCDPDQYPVAVGDETALAVQRFASIQANTEEFQAILAHNNLSGNTFRADQKLVIYQAHKKLAAIRFTLMGNQYQFQLETKDAGSGKGLLVTGLIDGQGALSAQQSQPAVATCPI